MKKIINYLLLIMASFFIINSVDAETIDNINMDIYVDSNGDAHITETWNVYATEKTEYYHAFYSIGNSKIENLKVKDENKEYTLINWNVNGSLEDKAYHYGYNYTNGGVELCFGKSSYGKHTYTLTYVIKSFVSHTEDADIIYWNLLDSIKPSPNNVEIVIYSDNAFNEDLPVWGYGNYGGLAYVYDGKIYLSNDSLSSNEYMVALVKFPLNTFNTSNTLNGTFDDWYNKAEEGSTKYKESDSDAIIEIIIGVLSLLIPILFVFIINFFTTQGAGRKSGNKTINFEPYKRKMPKDLNMFRDIPCDKDLFKAYWIAYNYKLIKKQTDFLGAILLKWLKQGYIRIESKMGGVIFKKEDTNVIFEKETPALDNDSEKLLYSYMYEASRDGILENNEFKRWCEKHYSKILNWFDNALNYENDKLIEQGLLTKISVKELKLFKFTEYQVTKSIYEDAKKMAGLKKFFNEFENMTDKEAIEVQLWEEYLMYAQIFGVADKVAKQFKKLYPDVINDYDYDSFIYISSFSHTGVNAASAARSRAESYSSGGGGFSSGGGGGGSFGGGGGGSR